MEEKENEIHYSLRSIPGIRNIYKFFSFKSPNPANHGFTLIELLVVISLVGILAAGVISLIDPIGQTQKAADGRRKSDLKQIQSGLELYRSDQGIYPAALGSSLAVGGTIYMQKIPTDPKYGAYYYVLSGSTYTLKACAEKAPTTDPDVVTTNNITGCTSGKNFQVTSP